MSEPNIVRDKLIHLRFPARGERVTLAVPPSSPWHELLPDEQTVTVREDVAPSRKENTDAAR